MGFRGHRYIVVVLALAQKAQPYKYSNDLRVGKNVRFFNSNCLAKTQLSTSLHFIFILLIVYYYRSDIDSRHDSLA